MKNLATQPTIPPSLFCQVAIPYLTARQFLLWLEDFENTLAIHYTSQAEIQDQHSYTLNTNESYAEPT